MMASATDGRTLITDKHFIQIKKQTKMQKEETMTKKKNE